MGFQHGGLQKIDERTREHGFESFTHLLKWSTLALAYRLLSST